MQHTISSVLPCLIARRPDHVEASQGISIRRNGLQARTGFDRPKKVRPVRPAEATGDSGKRPDRDVPEAVRRHSEVRSQS